MSDIFQIENTLKNIDYMTRWVGIPLEIKKGKYSKYHLFYIFNFIWLNTDVAGAFAWFFVGAQKGESLTSLTYLAPCVTISMLANTKSLCFIFYNKKVDELILSLKHLETLDNLRGKSQDKIAIIEKEIAFLQVVLKVLNFFNWFLMVSFPLMPLSLTLMDYLVKKEWNPILPFLVLYPFDAYDVRVYPFVFIRQIWSEVIVLFGIAGIDFTFFICCTYIKIQFRLLAYEVERLITGTSEAQEFLDDVTFKAKIKDVVSWHQQLVYAVELMETIYSKSTIVNFVSSSALICLTGFNVTTIEDKPFVLSFMSFLTMSLLQIYFLCFFGDMIMRASVGVSDAVYNSKWYSADKQTAKMLLIILTRAQKACKLTACGFADVNLRAFTKILSTAWSYFALLKTLYSTKEN